MTFLPIFSSAHLRSLTKTDERLLCSQKAKQRYCHSVGYILLNILTTYKLQMKSTHDQFLAAAWWHFHNVLPCDARVYVLFNLADAIIFVFFFNVQAICSGYFVFSWQKETTLAISACCRGYYLLPSVKLVRLSAILLQKYGRTWII